MRKVVRRLGRIKLLLIISLASILMSISLNFMFSMLMNQQLPTGEGILKAGLIPLIIAPVVSWYLLGLLLDLDKLEEKMNKLATYDDLTGLCNRRSLFKSCHQLHRQAQQKHKPYCVMLLDLDHFKKINDRYGHAGGDQVLQAFGHVLKTITRNGDVAGRIGGEEFCIFLNDTYSEQVQSVANRINQELTKQLPFINNQPVQYTVSIGVAENRFDEDQAFESILNKADIALYDAKKSGRNKVRYYSENQISLETCAVI